MFAYVDFTEDDGRKTDDIIALFYERETRDALGLITLLSLPLSIAFLGLTASAAATQWHR